MIICGYAGIGKSYLAKHFPGVIDLESTPFEKDWNRYLKCAMHYSNQGFLVFGIPFLTLFFTVVPYIFFLVALITLFFKLSK